MIIIEGIVTKASGGYNEREYLVTDGNTEFSVISKEFLSPGCPVSIEGELNESGKLTAKSIHLLHGQKSNEVYSTVSSKVKASIVLPPSVLLVQDEFTKKFASQMREIALELLCAKKLGRPISLRFHGDADGISGAIALTSILHCRAYQQNSAVYDVRAALRDIESTGQEIGHLAIFIDFGSGQTSIEGLKLLRAAGLSVLVIDHHPFVREAGILLLNPLELDASASKYTAGYMGCEIANMCGLGRSVALVLALGACAGDKSDILPVSDKDVSRAMVLDFLASHASFGNKLEFYRNVLRKQELFDSIAKQAEEEISDAAGKAMRGIKETISGKVSVCVYPLERFVKRGEWPPSSKVTTRIYDLLNAAQVPKNSKPLIVIGYTDRSIIMRINDPAVSLGLNANDLAQKMKLTMADFVEGGGGHIKAGAIKVPVGFIKDVLGELLREIERFSL